MDDGIDTLLRTQAQPTFVTINEIDFWCKIAADRHYCVVCFNLRNSQARAIPHLLRSLLRQPPFQQKGQRMGTVVHIARSGLVRYYTAANPHQLFDAPSIVA
jgi:hypothetical protein